jgi:hypothetical protein
MVPGRLGRSRLHRSRNRSARTREELCDLASSTSKDTKYIQIEVQLSMAVRICVIPWIKYSKI